MKRKKMVIGGVVFIFLAGVGLYAWLCLRSFNYTAQPIVNLDSDSLAASQPNLPWPSDGTAALSLNSGVVRLSHNDQKQLPTASVAKLMTALAILDKQPLSGNASGPTITISDADVALYNNYVAKDGSVVKVVAGETISERQGLEAMMLPSANNMADTMAIWAFGSIDNYTAYANQKAKDLGMTNSHFADDASGFSPSTVSTSVDLVRLGEAVLKNQALTDITGESSAVLPVAGTVHNVNRLLGSNGVFGLKTGNTDEAGGCFLFAAHVMPTGSDQTVTVIGAIMGAASLSTALSNGAALIPAVQANFETDTIIRGGSTVALYQTPWGSTGAAIANNTVSILRWKGQAEKPSVTVGSISIGTSRQTVGSISVSGGFGSAQTSLQLTTTLRPPTIWWRLTHPRWF